MRLTILNAVIWTAGVPNADAPACSSNFLFMETVRFTLDERPRTRNETSRPSRSFALLCFISSTSAQTASLSGQLTDQTGSVIADATVT